ncbi:MAG: sigma-54 dependent transcriptional regulator [Chitinophagales bacterium]
MSKLLIIDDEEKLRGLLARILTLEGFEVIEAGTAKAGLKKLETDIDVVICDVKLPDANGVELVQQLKSQHPVCEVILLTAYGNIPDSVIAIKSGAFDYITKGDDNNRIIPLVYKALEKVQLQKRVHQLENLVQQKIGFEKIIGESQALKHAIHLAQKVATTDTTVLITGETGTGKEVFAQAIHQASRRKAQSFVALNCAAFSKEILESELFGYKAGAFTGANRDKKGLLEEANGGTLFLDEIGEMSLELQTKLLRVLENGEYIKLGDTKTLKADVRILAATNRNLQRECEAGHFRLDLYYRLSVFQIPLPSLNERTKDIPLLAQFFMQQSALKTNKRVESISAEFLEALKQHNWKGNIRELKNIIERAVILCSTNQLTPDTLPLDFQWNNNAADTNAFSLSYMEKLHIQRVLNYTNGNKTEAAKLLGIGSATLYRKIDEYKL